MKRTSCLILFALVCLGLLSALPALAGTQDSAVIALHQQAHQTTKNCTDNSPNGQNIPCSNYSVDNAPLNSARDVYLVVAKGDPAAGIQGLVCGLAVSPNVVVNNWYLCADLDFPSFSPAPTWPQNGSGNLITWVSCQNTVIGSDGVHAVAGYFYMYAYGNGSVEVTPRNYISAPDFRVADCSASESDITAPGGKIGFGNVLGVNPCSGGTVDDPPTAVCQNATVYLDASGNAGITAATVDGGSTDDNGIQLMSVSPSSFTCADVGPNNVVLTVTDTAGQTDMCNATVTVVDNTPPSLTCQNTSVYLDANGNASITPGDVATYSDVCGIASAAVSPSSFTCANIGSNPVTVQVTDLSGNTASCMATVTVVDNMPPNAVCKDITVVLDANGHASITPDDVDDGSSDNCAIVARVVSPSSFDCADLGYKSVILIVLDQSGNSGICPSTVKVISNPQITSVTPAGQTVQYSDLITPVVVTVTDPCGVATLTPSGVPAGLSLNPTGPGEWTLSGQVLAPEGTYNIQLAAAEGGLPTDTDVIQIVVDPEDTQVAFDPNNPVGVQVEEDGGDSPAFTLAFDLRELDIPNNVLADANLAGDITMAQVSMTLVPVGPGPSVAGVCTPQAPVAWVADPDSPYDYEMRTVVCAFDNVPVNTYSVEVSVFGGYYRGGNEDVLTVFDPSLGFTTGGGYFIWPGTAGDGYRGDKTNFGFNVEYQAKGKNKGGAKGGILVIRHFADGSIARMKSNAMEGLAVGTVEENGNSYGYASFNGKCTFKASDWPEPIGNHTFVAYVEDHGTPGAGIDGIWLGTANGMVEEELSLADPATDNTQTILGGNIVVPHAPSRGRNSSADAGAALRDGRSFALFQNAPNPFTRATQISFQLAEDSHVRLSVFDVRGREVARLVDRYMTAGAHEAGLEASRLPAGVYFYRIQAGNYTETRRMMLLR